MKAQDTRLCAVFDHCCNNGAKKPFGVALTQNVDKIENAF